MTKQTNTSGQWTGNRLPPKVSPDELRERQKRSLLKGATERTTRKIKSGDVKVTLPYVKG